MKLYIDADVWLNFWQDEMLGLLPASHYAEELLKRAIEEKWTLVISGIIKEEIFKKKIAREDMEDKLYKFRQVGLLEEIEATSGDRGKAMKLSKERHLHLADAIHAILAIKSGAVIVTRNIKHFQAVGDLVKIRKPEDLL